MPTDRAAQPIGAVRVFRTLLLAIDDGVATITLNRPQQRNAVGDGMRDELADAYRFCDRDDAVRVVVLTGAPPAFCAGADCRPVTTRSPLRGRTSARRAWTCRRGRCPNR